MVKFLSPQNIYLERQNFQNKIFEARQKSVKSLKIFTFENFRLYGTAYQGH